MGKVEDDINILNFEVKQTLEKEMTLFIDEVIQPVNWYIVRKESPGWSIRPGFVWFALYGLDDQECFNVGFKYGSLKACEHFGSWDITIDNL